MAGIDMGALIAFAVGIVALGAYSGVGAIVLGALQDACTVTAGDTAIGYGLTALSNMTTQISTVATVIGVVFLLTIVMSALGPSANASRGI